LIAAKHIIQDHYIVPNVDQITLKELE